MKKTILIAIAALLTVNVWGQNWELNSEGNIYYPNKVGIGTTTVEAKLQVTQSSGTYGTSNPHLRFEYDTYNIADMYMNSEWDFNIQTLYADSKLILSTSSNQDIALMPNGTGNVGIGTTTVEAKLQVTQSSGTYGTSNPHLRFEYDTYNIADMYMNSEWDFNIQTLYADSKLILSTSSNQDIALMPNGTGNVGIGTTTIPSGYKLAVNGKIIATEIQVETGWADFVFEPNYNLMPLKELDTYIKENKHLPEIPTTAEVEKNGISVGEMNAKLLQKIEELTLHTIKQQELIETLVQRVEQLENK